MYFCICLSVWRGEGWPIVARPFRGLVVLRTVRFTLYGMKWLMYGMLFLHLSTFLGCFHPRTFISNNGLDMKPPLYQIYILMETFSALLALCAGNSLVPGAALDFTKASDAELWCFLWSNDWVDNRDAGDLRRHCVHYDVTVMVVHF